MCVQCYRIEELNFKRRLKFIFNIPKIFFKLVQRKYERVNKKYNHFWVSKTIPGKEKEPVRYYAKNAIKSKYDYSDIANSKFLTKKEYAEFMAAIFEIYQTPKNKVINKMGYMEYIENVSLVKTIILIPYVVVRIFKANTIGTLFN